MPTLEMSTGLDRMFDDMSHTRGTPFVSGINSNSTPGVRNTTDAMNYLQTSKLLLVNTASNTL